jgi:hypothetical protein
VDRIQYGCNEQANALTYRANWQLQWKTCGKKPMRAVGDSAELFRHVSAEKSEFYRSIMDVFAAAKRQYRLQLRPDEVLGEAG